MIRSRLSAATAAFVSVTLVATACGSDDTPAAESGESVPTDSPTIVVTTNILGDVVGEIVGDQAEVITIMPVGADPHDFQASAQEIDRLLSADALIVNGAGFEEGLGDVIESAETDGVPTFAAISAVATIEFGSQHHDEHADEDHSDEKEHSDEDHGDEEENSADEHSDHDHDGDDPHFFTDPMRMADAVDGIVAFLTAEVSGLDTAALDATASAYLEALAGVDGEVEALVDGLDPSARVLVTNHEVFGYFADRYGFEVVGTVIPTGSTSDAASAGELAELAETLAAEGVTAIFADTSSSDDLANALAAEVGDVEVVELYSESLGETGSDGATYLDMVRSNAERITAALS